MEPFRRTGAFATALLLSAWITQPARAGAGPIPSFDRDGPTMVAGPSDPNDPCQFFRRQAFNESLQHYSREMLWACEEIARRKAAGIPLSDRLQATAGILDTYREALIAGAEAFAQKRPAGLPPWAPALSEEQKYAIADQTGALLALEAIRSGF